MDRNEKESLHVAIVWAALLGFLLGASVSATIIERVSAKARHQLNVDFGGRHE